MLGKSLKKNILGMGVDVSSFEDSLFKIRNWAKSSNEHGKYVCLSNVHMCMEAYDSKLFQGVVNNANLVLADGKPIYWAQKLLGASSAEQIRGTELSLKVCAQAALDNIPIGLYGGSPSVLIKLNNELKALYPEINIVCKISPPYRPLTPEEDNKIVNEINASGAKILLVGLGCPKQEIWMADHVLKVNCVMLGVGAAFDFITGEKRTAPKLISNLGLEWFLRFACEPRRLWKRYLKHNPRYMVFFFKQWCFQKYSSKNIVHRSPNN